jgi:group I intron endonuclease
MYASFSAVYQIRNVVNGKVYVGQTVNLTDRWALHRRELNKGIHHCFRLQRAWVKHGEIAFVFEIIEAVEPNKKALDAREQVHLDAAFAAGLAYNVALKAGSNLGMRHSATTRAMISATLKGRPLTAETRAKMSAAHKGLRPSAETRTKMSASMRGNTRRRTYWAKLPAARRAELSLGREGLPSPFKGRRHSPESRAKMSAARKGIPRSAETIAKMSAAMMGNTRRRDGLLRKQAQLLLAPQDPVEPDPPGLAPCLPPRVKGVNS